jgi:hypothetical protein
MQIGDDTDIIATGPVYGDDCLHAQLVLVGDVEQPRINCAGRALIPIEIARFGLKADLCDRKRFTNCGKPKSLTRAFRYGMLYWTDPPQIKNCGLFVWVRTPASNSLVEDWVGNE